MHAIRLEGLGRDFGALRAVAELGLTIAPGEIFGLVGPDGAGKTTTLRMLAGILIPSRGQAFVDQVDVAKDPEALKARIGYMSQRFGLYPDLTVMENLVFYAELYEVPKAEFDARAERLLAFSDLAPFRRRRAGNLSGGMKQKLGLACALIHTPKVLLLDEPTNGVDPVSRRDFWRILAQLRSEGVTILVSTAYLDEAERCDRVGLLHQGRLLACDTVRGVKGLLKGTLLELCCERPRVAAARLREAGIGPVSPFGDRLHLRVEDVEIGRAATEAALAESGLAVQSLRVIEPSLEDVFISALPEEGR